MKLTLERIDGSPNIMIGTDIERCTYYTTRQIQQERPLEKILSRWKRDFSKENCEDGI